MEDVRRRFLPRFSALAKQRIREGLRVATEGQGDEALQVARELHSLAGEAGLLGLGELLALARTAEEAATQLHAMRGPERGDALTQALLTLDQAIAALDRSVERDSRT